MNTYYINTNCLTYPKLKCKESEEGQERQFLIDLCV